MKTPSLPLLSLILLVSMILVLFGRTSGNAVVQDMEGLPLRPDVPYYITSGLWPLGGGIVSLGKGKNETCPVDVILRENYCTKGTPVTFSIADGKGFFIADSTDLYISFTNTTSNCTNTSMVWKHEYDNSTNSSAPIEFLKIGGVKGDVNTVFRIVSEGVFGSVYQLVAYKFSSFGLLLSTSDVGFYYNPLSGIRRLALTEPPLIVAFQEAAIDDEGLKDGFPSLDIV